jgi:short-subunit dehydrogenase
MPRETALITGASSGIGLELAKLFASDKSNLVLVARRKDLLERLGSKIGQEHGVSARVLAKDLADPAAPRTIFDELAADGVQIDVLVNNAGFGAVGDFAELPTQRQMEMVQVNVMALTHLTRLFLPPMMERGRGGVLNVGSTAGFQPGPYMAVYYATKAYVLSFTEALAEEVAGKGIHVTCLAPGATNTGFAAEAKMLDSPLFRIGSMDVRPVAEAGYRGFRAGKMIVVPGLKNRLGAASVRFAPRRIVRKFAARLNRRK